MIRIRIVKIAIRMYIEIKMLFIKLDPIADHSEVIYSLSTAFSMLQNHIHGTFKWIILIYLTRILIGCPTNV